MHSYRKAIPRTKTGVKTRVEREHERKVRAEVAAYHKREAGQMSKYEFAWVVDGSVTVEADSEDQALAEATEAVKDQHSLVGLWPELEFLGKVEEEK